MKKNLGNKLVFTPLPVLIVGTYDAEGVPNAMNVAWGGQCGPQEVALNIGEHKSTENIRLKKAFTVAFADEKNKVQADFVGLVSGKKVPDKVKHTGWTVTQAPDVDAPVFGELPLTLECKVLSIEKTSPGENRVVGEVVNILAEESILDAEGRVDLDRLQPLVFDSSFHAYRTLGKVTGEAFKIGGQLK